MSDLQDILDRVLELERFIREKIKISYTLDDDTNGVYTTPNNEPQNTSRTS